MNILGLMLTGTIIAAGAFYFKRKKPQGLSVAYVASPALAEEIQSSEPAYCLHEQCETVIRDQPDEGYEELAAGAGVSPYSRIAFSSLW